jgi:hypothetical protein
VGAADSCSSASESDALDSLRIASVPTVNCMLVVMARALQQSLHFSPLPKSLWSPPNEHSLAQACSRISVVFQSYLQDFSYFHAHGQGSISCSSALRAFPGRLLSSNPSLQKFQSWPTLHDCQTDIDSVEKRQGRYGGPRALLAYREAGSDNIDYASDEETPSSSGFDSDWDDVERGPERAKTNDWRDMLQAKDKKELRAYAHAQKDSIGTHHVSPIDFRVCFKYLSSCHCSHTDICSWA